MLDHRLLTPLGALVTGVHVDTLPDSLVHEIRGLLADHGVVIIRDQHVDDHQFLRFLGSFGPLTFTRGETPVAGAEQLNVITNVGRCSPPQSSFHTDTSYVRHPPAYTALRAVHVPRHGGCTLFSNQYRAHQTLAPDLRSYLAGRTVTHVVSGLDLDEDAETSATHPLFLRHPDSGRIALYLSTPQRCAAVSGLSASVAAETIAFLLAHSTRADNVLSHRWSPGDVVMWDNRVVLHRADHDGVDGPRVMHRGMVAATAVVTS